MEASEIGARIARARRGLGLTQRQLAALVYTTNKAVSKWERGACVPDVDMLLPLSRTLGMTVQEILDGAESSEAVRHGCAFEETRGKGSLMPNDTDGQRTLRVDVRDASDLSPYLFGHNLEHTRGCVSGGLSAQMLRNRKFAGRPSRREGVAAEWFAIGERAYYESDRAHYTRHYTKIRMWRRNEEQAQCVVNLAPGTPCGIGQDGLFVRAGCAYKLAVIAQCSAPVQITARLTDRDGIEIYAETMLPLSGDDWLRLETELVCARDDANARLTLSFTEGARVIFGAVSLLPADSFRGMRPDVVARMREIGVRLLRWPGGNFAGEYRWQDMFLPVDMRAPLQAYTEDETQPYTHGYDMHEIDTDDFVALCRAIGAEPFITINLAWHTPAENAAWVEYCNGPADSPYGKMRAERGHAEPYNVRFWSLGNEMGYGHMEGPRTPEQYAALAGAQAEAMRKASPELLLFSSGPYPSETWTEKSAKALAPVVPYVSFHSYNIIDFDYASPEGIERTYRDVVGAPERNRTQLRAFRAQLGDGIHISYDEWNCWAAWMRASSTIEGMYTACMLHMMLHESAPLDVPTLCYFQPVGEGAIDVTPKEASLSANGQVFALLKAHCGGRLCRIEGLKAYEAVATIQGTMLSVSIVNDAYSERAIYALSVPGALQSVSQLEATDLLPGAHFAETTPEIRQTEETLHLNLPPRAIVLLRISI